MYKKSVILHDNLLVDATLSATATETDFDVDNLKDYRVFTEWKGVGTGVQYVKADYGSARQADAFGLINHNLATIDATIAIECSSNDFGPTGSDLVTNGGFPSDTSGWSAVFSVLTSIVGGESGNSLEIATTGAGTGSALQDVTVVVGKYYILTLYFKKGTGVGGFQVGHEFDPGIYGGEPNLTDAGWTQYTVEFIAATTKLKIQLQCQPGSPGDTSLFDTISLFELDIEIALAGFTPSNDKAFMKQFISKDKQYWRMVFSDMTDAPLMGQPFIGEALEMEKFIHGNYNPTPEKISGATSRGRKKGHHLGSVIDSISYRFRPRWRRITDSWFEAYFRPVWDDHLVMLKPFFWAWEPGNHPDDVFYAVLPDNASLNSPFDPVRRSLSLDFDGVKEI